MKNIVTSLILAVTLIGFAANAQTNVISMPSLSLTNAPAESGKTAGAWELTLGGGGTEIQGESTFGLDFSVSTNPLKARPEIWVGIAQSLYWEPSFAGSTDIFVDWAQNLWKDTLYANIGWSVGALYDNTGTSETWRTGPELTLQFYTSDNAFIYAGVNYDAWLSKGDNGFRYCFGVGLSF